MLSSRNFSPRCRSFSLLLAALTLVAILRGEAPREFLEGTGSGWRLRAPGATLELARDSWRLRLAGADGRERMADAAAPAFRINGEWIGIARITGASPEGAGARLQLTLANGIAAEGRVRPFGAHGFKLTLRVAGATVTDVRGVLGLDPVEELYGFGEMWNGRVAQRGQAFTLWDQGGTPDECAYMPYYVSTRNYAWALNYGGKVFIDAGQRRADQLVFEAPASEIEMMLVAGSSIASTVQNFFTEMGLPQAPPRWSYQPWFWLMSDPDQPAGSIDTLKGHHSLAMVDKLHALSIPVGVTWFEPPWQDARNSFIPNPAFSADFAGLVKQLGDKGVRALAWTVPYTTNTSSNWAEAVARGYLVKKPAATGADQAVKISTSGELDGKYYNAIDYFNPDAFAWWGQQVATSLATGIRGFKLDAGQDLPADALLHGSRRGADVHNSYATEYNRVFFAALKKQYGDDFLMVPRAAWLGSSAFTNFKWPGDLAGSFANNGLPSSVYSTLSLAFSGYPFVSTDIGGFETRPAPEHVWLRWAQFGAMLPGMQTLHMPWWYSPEAVAHFRFLAWLHTDLTPLWMTLAREAAATAAPVCRPLVWAHQDDVRTWRVDDQFLVGTSLLVAPLLNANPDRKVYLPAGTWYDFWDNAETFRGPAEVTWFKGWFVQDKFPLYIREGAIIPLEVTNDASGFGWAESAGYVTLAMWPRVRGESEFVLHDTEGPVRIGCRWNQNDEVKLQWSATRRNHLLRVHLATNTPEAVSARGGELAKFATLAAFRAGGEGWFFDAPARKLWVRKLNQGADETITLHLSPPNPAS